MLAAEYTNGSKNRPAILDITRIDNGNRETVATFAVEGRSHARKIAASHGAKCWNF